jgi:hypothetical protein
MYMYIYINVHIHIHLHIHILIENSRNQSLQSRMCDCCNELEAHETEKRNCCMELNQVKPHGSAYSAWIQVCMHTFVKIPLFQGKRAYSVYMHAYMHTCIHTYVLTYIHTYKYACFTPSRQECISHMLYVRVCMHVHGNTVIAAWRINIMSLSIYIYIYIYIYTNTHIEHHSNTVLQCAKQIHMYV